MRRLLMIGVAGMLFAAMGVARAAQTDVTIHGFAFDPQTVTIGIGDTVRWTNQDAVHHTVTSNDGRFDSGPLLTGDTFSFTFSNEGTFDYHCSFHPSMTGKIIVGGQATAPDAPANLTAKPGAGLGEIELEWSAPLDGGSPITAYVLCRSSGAAPECFDTPPVASFLDTGRTVLQTYTYTVSARNAVGVSPPSNSACSKPFPWLAILGC